MPTTPVVPDALRANQAGWSDLSLRRSAETAELGNGRDSVLRTRSKTARAQQIRCRARRLMERPIEYISSPEFAKPGAETEILSPAPTAPDGRSNVVKAPQGTPPYLASLYDVPLLTREQEYHLFRKMNFLKYRADQNRKKINVSRPEPSLIERIERDLADALDIRNQIVAANLRLVVSIAKTVVDSANAFEDVVSDGNVPLIRAAEIFDFERGTRFSTYATWAIRNSLYRSTPRNRRIRKRYLTGSDPVFDAVSEKRPSISAQELYHGRLHDAVQGMLRKLDSRDQAIVAERFGLNESERPKKFREIAEELDISTERVRQLLARSLNRMQEFAEINSVELD